MTATAPVPAAHRPGWAAWRRLIGTEARLVARDTGGLLVPIGVPVLILVMNALGADGEPIPGLGGLTAVEMSAAFSLPMILALIGLVNMPSFLATYRKEGVLRRLSATPAHPAMVLVAQTVVSALQALVGLVIALVIAAGAFGLVAPERIAAAVGIVALAAVALYAVGMLIAAVAPTPNAAIGIGIVLFFGMLASAGGFGGRDTLPDGLLTVGEALPYGAAVEALAAAWHGGAVDAAHLVALAAVAVLAGVIAVWRFRWE